MCISASARNVALVIFAALVLSACGQAPPQAPAPPPPAVTVANPTQRTIIDTDEYVGRFVAVDAVEVRARVSGYLEKVHFTDGQMIKQGDLLFSIDRRPFQNALDQARANLAQARANLSFADADLSRAQTLVRERTISEQVFEQRTQAKRIAEASVAAQEAATRQAALDIEFTEMRAPISGHIGDRRVSPGNLVTGGTGGSTTLLATIVSVDPIRFEFTFDEASYLRYQRIGREGPDLASPNSPIPVKLKVLDEATFKHEGTMNFVDNVIDRSTGTIRARAEFRNPNSVLTPGMFGRIQIPASGRYQALMVPEVAIASEQVRKYVMVVGPDNTATQKYVTLGQLVDGARVIKEGLTPEDKVIVNGLSRVRPNTKVTPQEQGAPPADKPPGAAPTAAKTN
jgi:RND family efflux transporter MFP subunit